MRSNSRGGKKQVFTKNLVLDEGVILKIGLQSKSIFY